MEVLHVNFDDPAWPDLGEYPLASDEKRVAPHLHHSTSIEVTMLPDGTNQGKPSVAFRINLPDGDVVIAQTTYALFEMAAAALKGRLAYLGLA